MIRSCNPASSHSHEVFPDQTSGRGKRPYAWPVEPRYLAALSDLGMSNAQIATYFRLKPADVRRIRVKVLDG